MPFLCTSSRISFKLLTVLQGAGAKYADITAHEFLMQKIARDRAYQVALSHETRYLFSNMGHDDNHGHFFFGKTRADEGCKKKTIARQEKKARLDTDKKSEEVIKKQLIESQTLKDKASQPATSKDQIEEVQKNFSNQLKQLGQCLAVSTAVFQDKVDPQF